MNILKNDKVVQTKEYKELKTVGTAYEVANFVDNFVILRDAKTKVAVGAIELKDFEECFKKLDEAVKAKTWTKWKSLVDRNGNEFAFYRTNFKKVQVRIFDDTTAEACCHRDDEFDLYFGIQVAYERAQIKSCKRYIESIEKDLKDATSELHIHKSNIKKLINSLEEGKEKV